MNRFTRYTSALACFWQAASVPTRVRCRNHSRDCYGSERRDVAADSDNQKPGLGASRAFQTDSAATIFQSHSPRHVQRFCDSPGFKITNIADLAVTVNTETRADFAMQVGTVSENVSVQAVAPLLQSIPRLWEPPSKPDHPRIATERAELLRPCGAHSGRNEGKRRQQRNGQPGRFRSAVSGIRQRSPLSTGRTSRYANVNNPAIALSLDAIQEFKVQVNFMDASYGHGAASIELITSIAGSPEFTKFRETAEAHPIEKTGRELRKLMSWVKSHDSDYVEGSSAR